ncbi:hypothetical protein BGX28_007611 [Mortierella sp. GBA30]|nr:hypothetical protein BGX28_007611 [Mortierella sp. GBA30]
MLPRNAVAIRKTLGTATEIITSRTSMNSHAMLLEYPPGSYTGMRTFNIIGILDFSQHTKRLANSLQQIRFPGAATEITVSTKDDPGTTREDPAATAGLVLFRQHETMKQETTDLVRAGLSFYYKQLKASLCDDKMATVSGETKVTVLCSWDPKIEQPTLVAHFEPLNTPTTARCTVEVHGSPRHQATAKNSQWVRDRCHISASMSKDSNEALLMDDSTQDLYEGLSSNFYAFDRKRRVILTAPLGSVLEGTIMKSVMQICKAEHIPVEFSSPNLKHIDEWEGAFISSMSRLVLPIEKLILPDGFVKHFEMSPTIELIRDRVQKDCLKRVENLLTEQDL